MLTITDATLLNIDIKRTPKRAVQDFYSAILKFGVNQMEMSYDGFTFFDESFDKSKIFLHEAQRGTSASYKNIAGQIYGLIVDRISGKLVFEIDIDSMNDCENIPWNQFDELRVVGTEKLFTRNYPLIFKKILKTALKPVSFSTRNAGYASTALTVEWVLSGGKNIVASYMGTGGYTPIEEAVMFLQRSGYKIPKIDTTQLAPIGKIWEKLTGKIIANHKPISGSHIFHVASGVHINGILKDSKNFEPFSPDEIGMQRKIILGKQSGASAIQIKLKELGLEYEYIDQELLLRNLKEICYRENRNMDDLEFITLVEKINKGYHYDGIKTKNISY